VAAHAVGHDEETLLRQQEEVVLVVVPLHPNVALAADLDAHVSWERLERKRRKQIGLRATSTQIKSYA
jgi:hypothetical protein